MSDLKNSGQTSEYCKGCLASSSLCQYTDNYGKNDGRCPCTYCLVKMICQNVCNEFNKYTTYYMSINGES